MDTGDSMSAAADNDYDDDGRLKTTLMHVASVGGGMN